MSEKPACRSCGSTKTRKELDAGGWVNCCPERAMNEVIERNHGVLALLSSEDRDPSQ